MRLRLLRRRLTISAPRMMVRSAFPWPIRWAMAAVVIGFCAAIGVWAFDFGREIAGIEGGTQAELVRLRTQLGALSAELQSAREQRDEAQSVANTANTLITTEKASSEKVLSQVKSLEDENRRLKDDLGFFEKLAPSAGADGVTIRALQAEAQPDGKIRWQVLLIQARKNPNEFAGNLEVVFSGVLNGKPWANQSSGADGAGSVPVKMAQYARMEGLYEVPAQVAVKSITVKLFEGGKLRATQSARL
jgi:hypothetical protein